MAAGDNHNVSYCSDLQISAKKCSDLNSSLEKGSDKTKLKIVLTDDIKG
jgi:hypothetical protein